VELTKELFLSPKKQKKAFLKVSLDDKRKILSKLLWNSTIDNKKLAKVSFKEPFKTLANCSETHDIDKLRGVRGAIRTNLDPLRDIYQTPLLHKDGLSSSPRPLH